MSRSTRDWYRRPHIILAEMVQQFARGEQPARTWQRAVVLAVDHDGGQLENPDGSGEYKQVDRQGNTKAFTATVGPVNPAGSIRARVLTDGLDRLRNDEDLRTFWPMLPPDQVGIPVAPGEHVYVTFEDGLDHGLWLTRVAGHDSANAFLGTTSYVGTHSPGSAMDSFHPAEPDYQKTEEAASLAPASNPTDLFGDD